MSEVVDIKNLTYARATDEDLPKILSLMQQCYPQLGWSAEFMEWQYRMNPAGRARIWVTRSGELIVGVFSAVPFRVQIKSSFTIALRPQDNLIHPEFRGMGVYGRLAALANNDITDESLPFLFTFPNESSHPQFLKHKWVPAIRIPLWTADIPSCVTLGPKSEAAVTPINTFDEAVGDIWSHASKNGIVRDSVFLTWRYMLNPKRGYTAFKLKSGDFQAICILKLYEKEGGTNYVHLIDCFWEKGFDNFSAIYDLFFQYGIKNHAKLFSTWIMPTNPLATFLRSNQFTLHENISRWMLIRTHLHDYATEGLGWHISMGDSDVF